jgi:hypothetical protein
MILEQREIAGQFSSRSHPEKSLPEIKYDFLSNEKSIEVRAFFTFLLILAAQRKSQTKTKLVKQNEG